MRNRWVTLSPRNHLDPLFSSHNIPVASVYSAFGAPPVALRRRDCVTLLTPAKDCGSWPAPLSIRSPPCTVPLAEVMSPT